MPGLETQNEAGGPSGFDFVLYYKDSRIAAVIDAAICAVLTALILLAPLPFGSVGPLSILGIESAALVCFFLWMVKLTLCANGQQLAEFRAGTGRRSDVLSVFGFPVKKTGFEWVALAAFSLFLLQLVPLPAGLTAFLFPATHAIYQSASHAVGAALSYHPGSLNAFSTLSKTLLLAAYLLIYLAAVNNLRRPWMFRAMIYAFCLSAAFQSFYGLYELPKGRQHIFGYAKMVYRNVATGTFINGNHYALCLEIAVPFLLAILIGQIGAVDFDGQRRLRSNGARIKDAVSGVIFPLFTLALISAALVFSISRSGVLFTTASAATFFCLYWKKKGWFLRRIAILFLAAVLISSLVLTLTTTIATRFYRLPEEWTKEGSRWEVWKDSIVLFKHFPVAGTGLGTFEQVYPAFHSSPDQTVFNEAHNDFLQLLDETGFPILILYAASIILLFRHFRKMMSLPLDRTFLIRLAAFCSMLSLLLHGLVDFPLEIPALAVLGSVVIGMFVNQDCVWNENVKA